MHFVAWRNVGPPNTPQEVKRMRREVSDMCRKMGQPAVIKHMYNVDDVRSGIAKKCPACFDSAYGQTRNDCPVCFGVGYVSVEDNPNCYISDRGRITADPSTGIHSPAWGGFGEGYLVWVMEPDIPVDVFKINEQGVMVQTQNAQASAPWWPEMHDNDLLVNVDVTGDGQTIKDTHERYQLKMTNPTTIRGWGRRIATGQEHRVQQTFEMSRAPDNNILYNVPVA